MASEARRAGLLLHPSSLPGGHGIGDVGAGARALLAWMNAAGLRAWQVLPLGPTDAGGSPYTSCSAFGGNLLLIDLQGLVDAELLEPTELAAAARAAASAHRREAEAVDFAAVAALKLPLVEAAAARLVADSGHRWHADFHAFCVAERAWLDDLAAFVTLRDRYGGAPWMAWPRAARDRDAATLAEVRSSTAWAHAAAAQFLFDRQWRALRADAAAAGIELIGDVPIYVALDSADVWAQRALFDLDRRGRPRAVAGVPPDAYAELGQLWGNPLYAWDAHAADDYAWWRARIARQAALCDVVRIDHFRGLEAYWAVPAAAADARAGRWRPGPGDALLAAIVATPGVRIIAEDLGTIDQAVRALRARHGLAGMAVLQFAWDGDADNAYLPHNHQRAMAVYTGTHDNDTTLGWWQSAPEVVRHRVRVYFGVDGHDPVWCMIRAALASVAELAVVPAQDVLALGSGARMNVPGQPAGNWAFRLAPGALGAHHAARLRGLVEIYGRLGRTP